MTDIEKLIQLAKNEIGVTENPKNSDNVKYNTEYYGREVKSTSTIKYYWCVVFQWWLMKKVGLSQYFYGGGKTASCSSLVAYHKAKGQVITSGYQRGDLILFNFSGTSTTQHIGLCLEYNGKTVTTIDGNTGTSNEANGGAVMKRTRTLSTKCKIICGIRWYQEEPKKEVKPVSVQVTLEQLQNGSKNEMVTALQILLNAKGNIKLTVDGDFGDKTEQAVKQYQRNQTLTADGVVGNKTWNKLLKG